ncbi:MAG: ABC transporter ATP-binding protein [Gloeomargarita sp. DG02_4_bins_56]
MLAFHGVRYTYPGTSQPVVDLDCTIPSGQKTVILGHNGSGKSTLLLLAAGLYACTQGWLTWRGERLASLRQWRRRVGLVFQNPEHQLVAATVAEDISYGLCNLALPTAEIHRRLAQTLTDFDLQAWAHLPLHHLSLGQKRRVALAGVMALQPELLLLDEPTTYLDYRQTQAFLRQLTRIHREGTTLVMATHDLDLAYAWADWVLVLDRGQVVQTAPAAEFFADGRIGQEEQLGVPTLWAAWYALPAPWRADRPPPKTIVDWQSYWSQPDAGVSQKT